MYKKLFISTLAIFCSITLSGCATTTSVVDEQPPEGAKHLKKKDLETYVVGKCFYNSNTPDECGLVQEDGKYVMYKNGSVYTWPNGETTTWSIKNDKYCYRTSTETNETCLKYHKKNELIYIGSYLARYYDSPAETFVSSTLAYEEKVEKEMEQRFQKKVERANKSTKDSTLIAMMDLALDVATSERFQNTVKTYKDLKDGKINPEDVVFPGGTSSGELAVSNTRQATSPSADSTGIACGNSPNYMSALYAGSRPDRWKMQNFPLKVFLDTSNLDQKQASFAKNAIANGFKQWEAAGNGLATFTFVHSASASMFQFRYVSGDVSQEGTGFGKKVLGATATSSDVFSKLALGGLQKAEKEQNYLTNAVIEIGTNLLNSSPAAHQEVVTHEIGHGLGIGKPSVVLAQGQGKNTYHSPNQNDLMRPTIGGFKAPSIRDLNTLREIYCDWQT